jgi:hypothetical protein
VRVEIARNFVTASECAELSAWAFDAIDKGWMGNSEMLTARSDAAKRVSTRATGHLFEHPTLVKSIIDRIEETVGYGSSEAIDYQGRDGMFVNVTYPGKGGHLMLHRDGRPPNGKSILRCNFLTSAPEAGGVLHLRGEPLDVGEGDLHAYLATEYEHFFDDVGGSKPRIMWIFGVCVDAEDWESGKIKFGEKNVLSRHQDGLRQQLVAAPDALQECG